MQQVTRFKRRLGEHVIQPGQNPLSVALLVIALCLGSWASAQTQILWDGSEHNSMPRPRMHEVLEQVLRNAPDGDVQLDLLTASGRKTLLERGDYSLADLKQALENVEYKGTTQLQSRDLERRMEHWVVTRGEVAFDTQLKEPVTFFISRTRRGAGPEARLKTFVPNAKVLYLTKLQRFDEQPALSTAALATALDNGNDLEEVVIKANRTAPQERARGNYEYADRVNLANTSGTAIDMSKINDVRLNVTEILCGRVAGVRCLNGQFIVRGFSSVSQGNGALVVVDGVPLAGNINTIDPKIIERIVVLRSLADTTIYGPDATNGVIVIETKLGGRVRLDGDGNEINELIYAGNLDVADLDLQGGLDAIALGDTRQVYNDYQSRRAAGSMSYRTEVALVGWFTRRKERIAAQSVLSNLMVNDTLVAREAGLYAAIAHNYPKMAVRLAENLKLNDPGRPQHAILANRAYRLAGNIPLAAQALTQVSGDGSRDLSEIAQVLNQEIAYLEQVDLPDLPDTSSEKTGQDMRMVLYWNQPGAQFQYDIIQGNDRKIGAYTHTLEEQEDRLLAEYDNGYAVEHFISEEAETGAYFIRLQNLEFETPVAFLHETIRNNGLENEQRTLHTVVLAPGESIMLTRVNNAQQTKKSER